MMNILNSNINYLRQSLSYWANFYNGLKTHRTIKILAIDGGGIRGIIPAMILRKIEEQTGKKIAEMFDLVAGTSTGGIIALMLAMKNKEGKPKYSAQQMCQLYEERGRDIFYRSTWDQMRSFGTLWEKKYPSQTIEQLFLEYFGDASLREAYTNVLISSYEIERCKAYFFNSHLAKQEDEHNFLLRDIARATTAAPTYFEPARIATLQSRTFIDGGLVANNPSMYAFTQAKAMFPDAPNFIVVSLGTGECIRPFAYERARYWGLTNWIQPMINVLFHSMDLSTEHHLSTLLPQDPKIGQRYYRFQIKLNESCSLFDDASLSNIERLKEHVRKDILNVPKQQKILDHLCKQIS